MSSPMRNADRKADRRFLQRMALDTLQRSLSPRETRVYLDAPAGDVVRRVIRSREAMAAWFEEELFYFLLLDNFRPKGETIERIPARLEKGEITARDAIGEILLSTGFSLRNPGNDTFVTVVLEQCLGYEVQDRKHKRTLESGKKMYDGRKAKLLGVEGTSQADILRIVLDHEDFARHLLDRHHRRLLGAPLPPKSQEVERLQQDFAQFFEVLADWITSDAYWEALRTYKPRSDRQFLRALYMDLLERTPSYEELRNMRNAMQSMADPAPLRSVMAKVILDSGRAELPTLRKGEEKEFVRDCFLRYLCREPGQEEMSGFLGALATPGAGAAHVVRALVGSVEYQYY